MSADLKAPSALLTPLAQLENFVAWERKFNPTETHVAEWALREIRSQAETIQAWEDSASRQLEREMWGVEP